MFKTVIMLIMVAALIPAIGFAEELNRDTIEKRLLELQQQKEYIEKVYPDLISRINELEQLLKVEEMKPDEQNSTTESGKDMVK